MLNMKEGSLPSLTAAAPQNNFLSLTEMRLFRRPGHLIISGRQQPPGSCAAGFAACRQSSSLIEVRRNFHHKELKLYPRSYDLPRTKSKQIPFPINRKIPERSGLLTEQGRKSRRTRPRRPLCCARPHTEETSVICRPIGESFGESFGVFSLWWQA
jgi:hypothetical protein